MFSKKKEFHAMSLRKIYHLKLLKIWKASYQNKRVCHTLLTAKKGNVPPRDQEFYDKAYNLLAEAHKALSENKGRTSDFQSLDKISRNA